MSLKMIEFKLFIPQYLTRSKNLQKKNHYSGFRLQSITKLLEATKGQKLTSDDGQKETGFFN